MVWHIGYGGSRCAGSGDSLVSGIVRNILAYIPDASVTVKGVQRNATTSEVQGGALATVGVTPAGLGVIVLGMGQTYQDVSASRASGVTYTNSTGRAILVSFWNTSTSAGTLSVAAYVAGVLVLNNITTPGAAGATNPVYFLVPAGATYSITFNSTVTKWFELR